MRNPDPPAARTLSVRRSGVHGKGVFAREPIAAGTRIIEYRGEHLSLAEANARYPGDFTGIQHTFLFTVNDDLVIDAGHRGNRARWINHSCDPNCESVIEGDHVYIESLRDIAPGEELTYDYHIIVDARHTPKLKKLFPCHCGAPGCRGTMLGKKR